MSKRPLAALCALLAFVAALVAVPLAASETAEAHTKTERRCTYNRQLSRPECQDVHVSHTHTDNTPEGRNGDSDGPRNGGIHTPTTTQPCKRRKSQRSSAESFSACGTRRLCPSRRSSRVLPQVCSAQDLSLWRSKPPWPRRGLLLRGGSLGPLLSAVRRAGVP